MSVTALKAIVEPPANPVDVGPIQVRVDIEEKLGLTLPQDFIDFNFEYGSGTFSHEQFWLLNPFANWYMDNVEQVCHLYTKMKSDEGDEYIPYEIFPQQPGLFPWGAESNGHQMFWLMKGASDEWPIILFNRDSGHFQELEMPVTTFLCKIFEGTLQCILWTRETQESLVPIFEVY